MKISSITRSIQSLAIATFSNRFRAFGMASQLRTLLLGGLLLGSTGAAMAQGTPSVKAKQSDPQSLSLTVENPNQQRMQMQVKSVSNNRYLMSEVNHNTSYGCKLNFSALKAGEYAVLVRVGKERYRYTVQVQPQAQPQNTISVPELASASATQGAVSSLR